MKKVLIIRCGALGDLVYATSVIDALRCEYGEDTLIDFVCTPGSATLFRNDPRINHVFTLKHKKIPLLLSKEKQTVVRHSKKNPYDILINFEYGKQFKSLLDAVIAKEKHGAQIENITVSPNVNRAEATKNFYKMLVSEKNLSKSYPRVHFQSKEELPFHLPSSYIVLSPSNSHVNRSGLNYRAWENEKWIELIQKFSKEKIIVIVGAKNEENFFQNLRPHYPENLIDLVGKNNVTQLCSVVAHADAVVCTDSAVGHIAAATNTPVFVLMGPNNPQTDAPYQTPHNRVNVISLGLDCSPCYKTEVMKNCKENICMKNISVEMVYNSIKNENIL